VKVFHCDHCGQLLFFENTACMNCGQAVAFLQFFELLFQIHSEPRASGVRPRTSDLKTRALLTSEVRRLTPLSYSMLDPMGWYRYFFPSQKVAEVIRSPPVSSA